MAPYRAHMVIAKSKLFTRYVPQQNDIADGAQYQHEGE